MVGTVEAVVWGEYARVITGIKNTAEGPFVRANIPVHLSKARSVEWVPFSGPMGNVQEGDAINVVVQPHPDNLENIFVEATLA